MSSYKPQAHLGTSSTDRTNLDKGASEKESAIPADCDGQASRSEVSAGKLKATGPRTASGKRRSSRNARKHGIFAEVLLVPTESKIDYRRLYGRLRENLQPVGALEDILVEKLAVTTWRLRRLLSAEKAEIGKTTAFLEIDKTDRDLTALKQALATRSGLAHEWDNSLALESSSIQLQELNDQLAQNGFVPEKDMKILEMIYSEPTKDPLKPNLYDMYRAELASFCSSGKSAADGACTQKIRTSIGHEIDRMKFHLEIMREYDDDRTVFERIRLSVPEQPALDRLIRYETSLERTFDRTLAQLERLQRQRLGYPVPPRIAVDVNS